MTDFITKPQSLIKLIEIGLKKKKYVKSGILITDTATGIEKGIISYQTENGENLFQIAKDGDSAGINAIIASNSDILVAIENAEILANAVNTALNNNKPNFIENEGTILEEGLQTITVIVDGDTIEGSLSTESIIIDDDKYIAILKITIPDEAYYIAEITADPQIIVSRFASNTTITGYESSSSVSNNFINTFSPDWTYYFKFMSNTSFATGNFSLNFKHYLDFHLTGIIQNYNLEPLENVSITFDNGSTQIQAISNASGVFEINGTADTSNQEWTVTASKEGYVTDERFFFQFEMQNQLTKEYNIALQMIDMVVSGTITDFNTTPLENVSIKIYKTSNDELLETAITDTNGTYTSNPINRIQNEEYYITLAHTGFNNFKSDNFNGNPTIVINHIFTEAEIFVSVITELTLDVEYSQPELLTPTENYGWDPEGGHFYTFTGIAGTIYDIITAGQVDTVLRLFDSSGNDEPIEENDDNTSTQAAITNWTCPANGTYKIQVTAYDADEVYSPENPYSILLALHT